LLIHDWVAEADECGDPDLLVLAEKCKVVREMYAVEDVD
jgi:hypothetical protein